MSLILLVIFVVAMLLWGISLVVEVPAPWSRASAFCAWISVLCLFFIAHGVRV